MLEGLTDEEIERRLRAAPEERWTDLWDALAAFEAEDVHGEWDGGPSSMPYVRYRDGVMNLVRRVYGLEASEPFDWQAWDGLRRYPNGEGLDDAPVGEAVRLTMAISRADRFYEGSLLAAADDGALAAIVDRLRRWHGG